MRTFCTLIGALMLAALAAAPAIAADEPPHVAVFTKDSAPKAPPLDELPLKDSVTQYGITWTFDKPAHVGQFINGDFYVVGPVTVKAIAPKPLYGDEIPTNELDHVDLDRPVNQRVRNGFMLNPPAAKKVSYDSGVRNWFDASLIQKLPVAMKAGDSLVSTISMPKGLKLDAFLWHTIERGVEDSSPIRVAAVLTCVDKSLPADAFRPAFCDRQAKIFYSHDLKREMLPSLKPTKSVPDIKQYIGFTQRPWVGTCFFGFEEPVENMPQYGREYGRIVGLDALLLCTDFKPEEKEPLLVDFVQVGIDLGGMIKEGHPGFEGFGGHGSGRKLPIVFAGLLLGDEQLANINKSFPKACFGEDEQTAYGDCWTGAKVVFTGHRAIDEVTGLARPQTGPYEHKQPSTWTGAGPRGNGGDCMSEAYRHTASFSWVAQALVLRLLQAENAWDHDAFLDYVDRWMYEDDTPFNKIEKEATGKDHSADWERQGQCFDPFVTEMWFAHRADPGMPGHEGWKQEHDESYYKNAIAKGGK